MKKTSLYNTSSSHLTSLVKDENGVETVAPKKEPIVYTEGLELNNQPTKSAIVHITGDTFNPSPCWGMTI